MFLKRYEVVPGGRFELPQWVTVDAGATGADGHFALGPVAYDPTVGSAYRVFAFDQLDGLVVRA